MLLQFRKKRILAIIFPSEKTNLVGYNIFLNPIFYAHCVCPAPIFPIIIKAPFCFYLKSIFVKRPFFKKKIVKVNFF
jgi:hypothetical protein